MKIIFNKIVLLLITWLSLSICFAAGTDYSALTNNLAIEPGIQGATKGYDLLSGKVTQNIPLVKGNLPFTMQYHATLRLEGENGPNLYQELDEGGVADWTNEYSGYVITSTIPSVNTSVFIIQLPGSSEKYLVVNEGGKLLKRIYHSGAGQFEAKTFYSENLRDISFKQVNSSIVIVKDGVKYTASIYKNMESVFGSTTIPSYLYKFTEIQYQDGRKLNLSYDNGYNLVQVKDNRNNTLNILREYKKFGSSNQTYLERKLITGVELISGSNVQRSSVTYQENQVKSIIDPSKTETRYTISSINSIVTGNFSFQYEDQSRGYWIQYVLDNTSRKISDSSEGNYPILKRVIDQNKNVLREYEYGNVWQFYNNTTSVFLAYTTQITAYTPLNNQKTQRSISAWNDIRGEFANRFTVNGQDQTMDYTMTGASLPGTYNQAELGLMLSATATMTVQGNYPGLLSGSTPIRSVQFNPFTHRLKSITDLNGNVSTFNYDQLNRLSQKTIASGTADSQSTTYNYTVLTDGAENRYPTPNLIVTDGQKVTNSINANGWIVQQVISYPKGGTSKTIAYSYYNNANNANNVNYGLISSVDGPRADVNDSSSFTYDSFGNRATITQNVNNRSVVTKYLNYNTFAQPERIIYPSGLVDKFIYNQDGTLQSKATGNGGETGNVTGAITSYTYDYLKRKISETNPDNEVTTYAYDSIGQLVRTTLPDGTVNVQTYFDNGVIKSTDGAFLSTNEINTQGFISRTSNGNVSGYYSKSLSYDPNGNLIQTQSSLGFIEKWTYDALNRNTSHTDAEGKLSTNNYDKSSNLIAAKDAVNSGSSPFNYINDKFVKDEINNDYGTKSYKYNQADQLVSKSHASRICNYSNIDSIGRIGNITCSSENDADPAYAYNYQYTYDSSSFGHLDKVFSNSNFGVDTTYTYDNLDRVIGKNQTNKAIAAWGGTTSPLNVKYSYSIAGKIKSITMPSGRVINYNYEATKGRIASISIAGNPFITNVSYNNFGQVNSWSIANTNSKYLIDYNEVKALTSPIKAVKFLSQNNVALYSEEYSTDQDGRVLTIKNLNNKTKNYSYDRNDRLTSETTSIGAATQNSWSYGYDANGNLITKTSKNGSGNAQTVSYTIGSATNRLTSKVQSGSLSGNYLSTGELRFAPFLSSYDGNGQMRYSGGANNQYYMAYNYKNERTLRAYSTVGMKGGWYEGAIQFVYDENSNLIGEYTVTGVPLVEYVWMENRLVAAIYGAGAGKIYAVVTDRNATPRMLVDSSTNSVVWQWESNAFGAGLPTGSVKFNLRFPGQYYDEFTGLHYNLNRYYNPELGRYMEPDPIGLEGGVNPYVYADNNPLTHVDSSGLDSYNFSFIEAYKGDSAYKASLFEEWGLRSFNLPDLFSSNQHLLFNGGPGTDVQIDAEMLRVTPNGEWTKIKKTGQYVLPVRANGYRNHFGQWVDEGLISKPSKSSKGYWVHGQLMMREDGTLLPNDYNFEQHKASSAFDFKTGIRNWGTVIGAREASNGLTNVINQGFKFKFTGKPYCPACKPH